MGLDRGNAPERRFGVYLRRLRERRKLTLEAAQDLSTTLHVRLTSSYLSRLESGLTVPNLTRLSALSRVYDLPLTTLVEKFELEQRRDAHSDRELPRSFEDLEALLRRKLQSGAYLDVLRITSQARLRLEEDAALATEYTRHGERYLRLVECQAMVHLELYESAKFESERVLELPDLRTEHRLAAWQFFVGCCTKLQRYKLALAALDQAEREAQSDDAPERMLGDFSMLRGNVFVLLRDYRQAVATYAGTLKLYRAQRNKLETCRTRIHLGGALTELGKLSAAQRYLVRAVEEAERAGYEQLRAFGLAHLAALAWKRGDHRRVEAYGYRSAELAKRLGLHAAVFKSNYYLMLAAEAAGDDPAKDAYVRLLSAQLDYALPPTPELDGFRELLARRRNGDRS